MKFYSKVKSTQKLGFRTPEHFKGKVFSPNKPPKFNPSQFKTQHKG
ncbi:MAG: hypothetical protein HYS83_02500 [Candidatus Blackburnbacteria bacterium]|nr:hypothetical protein [Candidatus Blackburnbacteria bacterium]